jgi:SAM-dependent methyltransferase
MNIKIYNRVMEMIKNAPSLMTNPQHLKVAIKSEFDVEVEMTAPSVEHLVDAIDEQVLANYFGRVWQPKTKKYKYSGLDIIDEVNALEPTSVLDLGCGYNEFKGKINNVTGVDPFNDRADHKCSILEYQPDEKYDVTIVMGSINFGSADKIIREMSHAVSLTAPEGLLFFRANPGKQHEAPEAKWIDFFNWTPEFIINLARELNLILVTIKKDANRLYFVLKRR